tara:strand:- start:164 stop:370 length:207 start_codon:yes stop_codon:yes gene_type:complete
LSPRVRGEAPSLSDPALDEGGWSSRDSDDLGGLGLAITAVWWGRGSSNEKLFGRREGRGKIEVREKAK